MIARGGWGLLAAPAALIVHASESWFESIGAGQHLFFNRFVELSRPVALVRAESALSRALCRLRRHRHILAGAAPHRGPWDFHADVAYVPGYWRLDPQGSRARSSLAGLPFPGGPSGEAICAALRSTLPPEPCAAVFFAQDIEDFRQPLHWLDSATILRLLAREGAGKVVLKLHPRQRPKRAAALRACAEGLGIALSESPAAALIRGAGVVVTQNSATGFTALIEGRPVITCARSDYGAATMQARNEAELAAALRAPEPRDGAAFVRWYLETQCLHPEQPDFLPRLARLLA